MKIYLLMVGDSYEGYYVSGAYKNKRDAENEKTLREKEDKENEEEYDNYFISEQELIEEK